VFLPSAMSLQAKSDSLGVIACMGCLPLQRKINIQDSGEAENVANNGTKTGLAFEEGRGARAAADW
jgi:hypothetical protein